MKALPSARPNLVRDLPTFAVFATVIFAINWGLRGLVIEPLVRTSLKLKRAGVEKFAQSFMEMFLYGSFALLGLLVVPKQEFAWPSELWWRGFPQGEHDLLRSDLRCYYLLYAARYFQGGISILLEHRRKDFVEMQIHHWVTVSLIFVSYINGCNHIGAVIMVLFDPADVPLHLAKLFKYTADATQKATYQTAADILFAFFAVVFLATRLICYPYVVWSAQIETRKFFTKGIPEWTCMMLLYALLALQIYWFTLLLRAAIKMFTAGGIEDVRSDDSDDQAEPTTASKTTKKSQ